MNPLKPFKAKIEDIKLEAEGVKTYTLSTGFQFTAEPGQFNMVGYPGVGEAPISLSGIMQNGCFKHTIKSVGRVTEFLDHFMAGDEVFFRGPYGKGWPIKKAEKKDLLIVAGGVGLAPLRPVVQLISGRRELFGEVSLICGARNENNMPFMDELKEWAEKISVYLTVDEAVQREKWQHHIGLVIDLFDRIKIRPERTISFICGPEIMMRFVCRGLMMRGLSQASLYVSLERRMKCGMAQCGHCQHSGFFVCQDGPVFSYKEVRGLPDGML